MAMHQAFNATSIGATPMLNTSPFAVVRDLGKFAPVGGPVRPIITACTGTEESTTVVPVTLCLVAAATHDDESTPQSMNTKHVV
mmetsp:Transcript_18667/g.31370  ORF Transcript_18667/g.31370 Transcript_18667/m.31370 type:complete len:84 (+) Transcript_18667:94-345(+)|eukprot:CAMPEP_0198223488 /NCGR_PEP_ID=MMETSP1445-20131203/92727_1 /TAXON_ID=36898 /ORGANISM="Pyramimonas sp., Strain CCMP2087" /LENGTH=83 /DNA_ID=CAMNT_0043902333 /DNA_START=34 /DNA_END=285 /DNA_ORIENTATION=+